MIYIADLFVFVLIIISYFVDKHLSVPLVGAIFSAVVIPLYLLIINILSKPYKLRSVLIRYIVMVVLLVAIYFLNYYLWTFRNGNSIYQVDSKTKYLFREFFLLGMFIVSFIWVWWYNKKYP